MKKAAFMFVCVLLGIGSLQAQMEERLGDKLFELGEYQKALAQYMQCLDDQSDNVHDTARVGDCYVQLNQPEQAIEWYRETLNTGEAEPGVILSFGHCLKYLGEYEKAMDQYERVREQRPQLAAHYIASLRFAMERRDSDKNQIDNLAINSSTPDFGPAFLNGRLIYSTYQGVQQPPAGVVKVSNTGGVPSQSHLFSSQKNAVSGDWSGATQLQTEVQRVSNIGPVQYNESGTMIAFTKNNFRRGVRQIDAKNNNLAIYLAETTADGGWKRARAFPHNGMGYSTTSPCFSPDGKRLYFASNRDGGEGGYDIYYSTWSGSNWTEPVNAGKTINSPGNEWISEITDSHIYFSSDWHDGFGGMDIFKSQWNGSEASNIKNLGYGVNSSRDDYGYTLHGSKSAYFTSNRPGGQGYEDIYRHAIEWEDMTSPEGTDVNKTITGGEDVIDPIRTIDMQQLTVDEGGTLTNPDLEADNITGGEKQIKEVYSIQIAVFQDKETDVQRFVNALGDLGDVYKLYFDRVIKIRVGNFSAEQQARKTLDLVQQRGYRDAFVVKEQIVKNKSTSEDRSDARKDTKNVQYKVRLAAYSNPKWFDPSDVEHLGLISTRDRDGFTIVYLGNYPSIEEAEETRVEVMDAGFTSAQLVRVKNGEYSILR